MMAELKQINYESPVTKINVAVNKIPNFKADPNSSSNVVMPHHRCTIHLNCEDSKNIGEAYLKAQIDAYSKRPMIELIIPSSLDPTLAPPGHHVMLLFTQNTYADIVFDCIEDFASGFKDSVVGRDILSPPDLERVFSLTGGNIFHGAMSLDQLYMSRPMPAMCNYRSPVRGLYLCGSGAHPGGGVMGSPGRLAAMMVIKDRK
ncbi:hypothetical protein DPMN_016995 [Dreissena polymorpha]|uniref:Uncharacterized protein n=1 Tax=Dreissena polymorpha TaxID=45954 RepID=A0A9D4S7P9_DREPO|nr:hypothetical protein DPMN_016995 [Dreissena polymorpha]